MPSFIFHALHLSTSTNDKYYYYHFKDEYSQVSNLFCKSKLVSAKIRILKQLNRALHSLSEKAVENYMYHRLSFMEAPLRYSSQPTD